MFDPEYKISPYFGERLRRIREACSLTQDTLAEATGIERSTLAYYESGRVYPSFNRMKRIAAVLCISLDVLLRGEYHPEMLWDGGFQDADRFFGTNTGAAASHPVLPENLGDLQADEQLLILYYRQLKEQDKTKTVTDISSLAEHTQRELYGLDEDDSDIDLTETNLFDD